MMVIASIVAFALAVALTFWTAREARRAQALAATARHAIREATQVPATYVSTPALDLEKGEHLARIAEAAANIPLRSLLVRLREEALREISKGATGDVGSRALGRIEAYSGVQTAMDVLAGKWAQIKDGEQN